jgi:phosphoribosylformylglycinamidine synthase
MTYRVHIHIVPRKGLLDPQGKAVADALHALGFNAVRDVRIGRHLVVDTTADTTASAEQQARAMCERLLANPVTEDFELSRVEAL